MKSSTRWGIALLAASGLGLVLAFVLSLLAQGPAQYERHFVWLFWVNVAVASGLVVVLGVAAARLLLRVRARKFGSQLLLKLAAIFALVGVLPGALLYTVSYQFVSRSIDAWFDTRTEQALQAGLALGKGTLEALASDLQTKVRLSADRLADARGLPDGLALERLREQLGVREAALLAGNGQVMVSAGTSAVLAPERPPAQLLRQARSQRAAVVIEGLEEDEAAAQGGGGRIRAVALVPSASLSLAGDEERYLVVVQELPQVLTRNALTVQAAYRDYQARSLARDGLRRMYIGTLTLAMVLAVFGAVLLAIVLGNQIARPLLLLAEGVRQVAAGDLGAKPVFASRDELGGLTRNFAAMTEQLGSAREQAERSLRQLESARTRLQTILDNLTAGVIVFDRQGRIDTVNPGATRILRAPLSAWVGRELHEVPGLAAFAESVAQRFSLNQTSPEAGERDQWQDAFELPLADGGDTLTLLVRGAMLPGQARLMVFDDITEVVSAQRAAAWSEVARRLAHEIKNPLTPIQLSAERLQHKLEAKLAEPADQAMLARSVATIVNQVQAMKQLVNEFRDYARLPSATMGPLDLNALVAEVLALYGNEQDQGRLSAQCAAGLPPIRGDATQLRQVVHNLVQNALDAVGGREDGQVRVLTETATQDDGRTVVRLKVADNGPGFAEKVLKRAFEPYVTTKSKGTGLGLAVVKKIADEHGARIRIVNLPAPPGAEAPQGGAQVSLSFSGITGTGESAVMPPAA